MSEETTSEKPVSAGELLRQGRLRQRLSVLECAKRTHVSVRYLEALEDERWNDLPSESHRMGFLRLYSRFLGVSADDVMNAYEKGRGAVSATTGKRSDAQSERRVNQPERRRDNLYPKSWQQVLAILFLSLLLTWVLYHAVGKQLVGDQRPLAFGRSRQRAPRLVAPNKPPVSNQKVRITAGTSSWMRILGDRQLLYEGILPAGSTKEWNGSGIFTLRLSDPKAVLIFWNDQPVDLAGISAASDLTLPLGKQAGPAPR